MNRRDIIELIDRTTKRNPSGSSGSGGSKGNGDVHVTSTTTNPVVPDDMQALAGGLNGIATGGLGAPVNLGALPGLDAAKAGPLIPQGSLGALFSSPYFNMGMNKLGITGGGQSRPTRPMPNQVHQPTNWGSLFSRQSTPRNMSY